MILFANTITSRLQFISNFIGKQIIGEPFQITTDATIFRKYEGAKINYSNEIIADDEFRISNSALLFENEVKQQGIECFEVNNHKAFFKIDGDFDFDIFAASFYLLSRYEEYLPHQKDLYGRYAHENSLAYKENFLHLPLINIWLEDFKKALKKKFLQLIINQPRFTFIPTYDIDEAFSYKYKQWWRTAGGILRSAMNGQASILGERKNVLSGRQKDPYDAFEWMDQLHKEFNVEPIYFFLIASVTGKYDKNILPSEKAMQQLILDHAHRYSIAIHPSWQSGDDVEKLRSEISTLSSICKKQIHSSRQHYIRFTLPQTFRQLIREGIESDFSMGYGSINGFRASVASPFYWYDMEKEEETKLLLYPFCFMDANSFYEQKFSAQQAFEEIRHYYNAVRSVNGTLIIIWHNSFLGTGKIFEGWREVYKQFISLASS